MAQDWALKWCQDADFGWLLFTADTRQVQASGRCSVHSQFLALNCVWAPRSPLTYSLAPRVLPLFSSSLPARLPAASGQSLHPLWRSYGSPCPGVRQHLLQWLSRPLLCGTYGLLQSAATELPRLVVVTPSAGGHSLRMRPPSGVQGRGAVTSER